MQKEADTDQLHKFIQICQRHRLKITSQRVAIYQNLLGMNTHPTADAVYQILRKEYPHIFFDTVNPHAADFYGYRGLGCGRNFQWRKAF
jgi:Fur family transcriptional regulator, peroxide stress response regulator